MNYTQMVCERTIIDNVVEAKHALDVAKKRYDDARSKLIEVASTSCEYSSLNKVAGQYLTETHKVLLEPRLKLAVFDHEKMPPFIKPYIKVVETVTLTPAGKIALDKYLSDQYGPVDYNHPQSAEFFGTLGMKSSITMTVVVKSVD